jgi:hypothetical protein
MRWEGEARALSAGGKALRRLPDGAQTLEPYSWRRTGGEIAWCADLPAGELSVVVSSE